MGNGKPGKILPSYQYKVTVKTNDGHLTAGTTSRVYLKITGDKPNNPQTKWLRLHHTFGMRDFFRGKTSVFFITCADVGAPLILDIRLRGFIFTNEWACSRITVEYGTQQFVFPFEDWISDQVSIARGEAYASGQVPHTAVSELRRFEVDKNKIRFQWIDRSTEGGSDWNLPRYINESSFLKLPSVFQWSATRILYFVGESIKEDINKIIEEYGGRLTDYESYSHLYKYLTRSDDPVFYDCWKTDEEFGRQLLLGISPYSFSRCTKIPDNCQITADVVKPFLKFSLETEMKDGKIYLSDYSTVFQGVPRTKNAKGEDLYCPDAFCLYYVNEKGNLVPIAIQLVPGDKETIFTPGDHEDEWLLAKMYFKVAFGNMHEWYYHLLLTHNVMETFSVALFRCFPRSHPIYKLLRPHLQTIPGIQTIGRQSFLSNKPSPSSQALNIRGCIKHMFKDFTMDDLVIPDVLKKKGLDDPKLLPKFYYRDDALNLWKITEQYVRGVIENYYKTDKHVFDDYDLQSFAMEMAYEGFGWQDNNRRGIPTPIRTRTELTKFCTTIAFTTSIQHAAVNFGQFEYYKFIPNSPLAMRLPPPKRGEVHPVRIMQSLPDLYMSIYTINLTSSLSIYSPNEVYLGNFPLELFTEGQILKLQGKYQNALSDYSKQIKERNANISEPSGRYWHLLPEKIPQSIAI